MIGPSCLESSVPKNGIIMVMIPLDKDPVRDGGSSEQQTHKVKQDAKWSSWFWYMSEIDVMPWSQNVRIRPTVIIHPHDPHGPP